MAEDVRDSNLVRSWESQAEFWRFYEYSKISSSIVLFVCFLFVCLFFSFFCLLVCLFACLLACLLSCFLAFFACLLALLSLLAFFARFAWLALLSLLAFFARFAWLGLASLRLVCFVVACLIGWFLLDFEVLSAFRFVRHCRLQRPFQHAVCFECSRLHVLDSKKVLSGCCQANQEHFSPHQADERLTGLLVKRPRNQLRGNTDSPKTESLADHKHMETLDITNNSI